MMHELLVLLVEHKLQGYCTPAHTLQTSPYNVAVEYPARHESNQAT